MVDGAPNRAGVLCHRRRTSAFWRAAPGNVRYRATVLVRAAVVAEAGELRRGVRDGADRGHAGFGVAATVGADSRLAARTLRRRLHSRGRRDHRAGLA